MKTQSLKQSPDPRNPPGHPPSSLRRGGSKKRPKVKVEAAPREDPREGDVNGDGEDNHEGIDNDNESGSDYESGDGQEEGRRQGSKPLGSDSPNRFQHVALSRVPSARSQQLEVRRS